MAARPLDLLGRAEQSSSNAALRRAEGTELDCESADRAIMKVMQCDVVVGHCPRDQVPDSTLYFSAAVWASLALCVCYSAHAVFWFASAMCRLPSAKPSTDELDTITELSKALQRMNRWNFWAAGLMGVTALLSALGRFLIPISLFLRRWYRGRSRLRIRREECNLLRTPWNGTR